MHVTLTGEHEERTLRAVLDHLEESLDTAAEHVRRYAEQLDGGTLALRDARDHTREAARLLDIAERFQPS